MPKVKIPSSASTRRSGHEPVTIHLSEEDRISPSLVVYCLGAFRIFQNEKWIEAWPSRKAQLIFKYLLVHRHTFISKDILMDTFWRDSDPEAARRNLHQAIYALRQTLKNNGAVVQHILFENDGYCLNPEMNLWADYDEFQERVRIGQQLMRANRPNEALEEYIIAESLYQGDFLADDIYEDWLQAQRQSLMQMYLSVTSYLTEYHLARGEYAAAITLCQRILFRDSCQEEAHRNLMHCYIQLGQRNLAIRQYQVCLKALKDELGLPPSEETQALHAKLIPGAKQATH